MSYPVAPQRAKSCLWMSAGLLTYKLCDRDFDCDCCPLDAALRGGPSPDARPIALLAPHRETGVFPDDRLYTSGHSWVQAVGEQQGGLLRFGLDAFAAAIIGYCREVHWPLSGRMLTRGETICRIDVGLGTLSVGIPIDGAVEDGNRDLAGAASRIVTARRTLRVGSPICGPASRPP